MENDCPVAGLVIRVYIAGASSSSAEPLARLKSTLEGHPHELEVVDVSVTPERALDDGVIVTPTLMRLSPAPPLVIVGMPEREALLRTFLS